MSNEEHVTSIEETNDFIRKLMDEVGRNEFIYTLRNHHLTWPTIWMDKDGIHARNPTPAALASWEEYTVDENGTYHLIKAKDIEEEEE